MPSCNVLMSVCSNDLRTSVGFGFTFVFNWVVGILCSVYCRALEESYPDDPKSPDPTRSGSGSGSYLDVFLMFSEINNLLWHFLTKSKHRMTGVFLWIKDPDPDPGDLKNQIRIRNTV